MQLPAEVIALKTPSPPICPYCDQPTHLITGHELYPHLPRLYHNRFYRCDPCEAHVGCHPGTTVPLGRVVDKELRRYKIMAHEAFDRLWQGGGVSRSEAYRWLADRLGLSKRRTHIGWFDKDQCQRVITLCKEHRA